MAAVVIAADAAPAVGMGHVSRCSAIAAALAEGGVPVRCLAHGAAGELERDGVRWTPAGDALGDPDGAVVVVDGYRFATDAVGALAARRPVALLYDGGPLPGGVALVVAPIAAPVPAAGAEWLGGFEHACLRRGYWNRAPRAARAAVARVLVTTGAGPAGAELGHALAAAAREALPDAAVSLIRAPDSRAPAPAGVELRAPSPSLRAALLEADLVVATAGQTALEAAACGTPAVLVALDRAQAEQAARLERAGAARVAGAGDAATVMRLVVELAVSRAARAAMAAAGQTAVDGRGALRVAARIAALRERARRGAGA